MIEPSAALLLYVALVPLYYVQYLGAEWAWIEHLPVWGLLAWGGWRSWRGSPMPVLCAADLGHA